jgi:uncharacterized Zn finger protein
MSGLQGHGQQGKPPAPPLPVCEVCGSTMSQRDVRPGANGMDITYRCPDCGTLRVTTAPAKPEDS